jgi:hypothetical protein
MKGEERSGEKEDITRGRQEKRGKERSLKKGEKDRIVPALELHYYLLLLFASNNRIRMKGSGRGGGVGGVRMEVG